MINLTGAMCSERGMFKVLLQFKRILIIINIINTATSGPYWCAEDDVEIALNSCMTTPDLIVIDDLVAATRAAAEVDSIDE